MVSEDSVRRILRVLDSESHEGLIDFDLRRRAQLQHPHEFGGALNFCITHLLIGRNGTNLFLTARGTKLLGNTLPFSTLNEEDVTLEKIVAELSNWSKPNIPVSINEKEYTVLDQAYVQLIERKSIFVNFRDGTAVLDERREIVSSLESKGLIVTTNDKHLFYLTTFGLRQYHALPVGKLAQITLDAIAALIESKRANPTKDDIAKFSILHNRRMFEDVLEYLVKNNIIHHIEGKTPDETRYVITDLGKELLIRLKTNGAVKRNISDLGQRISRTDQQLEAARNFLGGSPFTAQGPIAPRALSPPRPSSRTNTSPSPTTLPVAPTVQATSNSGLFEIIEKVDLGWGEANVEQIRVGGQAYKTIYIGDRGRWLQQRAELAKGKGYIGLTGKEREYLPKFAQCITEKGFDLAVAITKTGLHKSDILPLLERYKLKGITFPELCEVKTIDSIAKHATEIVSREIPADAPDEILLQVAESLRRASDLLESYVTKRGISSKK